MKLRAALTALPIQHFASSLQENPGDVGEHSEKGEQQLEWLWNRFGFTFVPPNPGPGIAAVQAPLQES